MTEALFAPIPVEEDRVTLPNGATIHVCDVSPVPSTGETVITLGIEWDDGKPLGAFYGVVTVDALGTIVGTLDGVLPCPYSVGDQL